MARAVSNLLLRTRDGRLFLAAQSLDALAIGVAGVALPWLVLDGGGSSGAAGLVFTVTLLPYVLFGLPAGVVGDRFPRRRVLWISHAVQAVFATVIPTWSFLGTPPIPVVLVAAFAIGSGRVFADAAAFGAVASIVGREQFTRGQATLSGSWALGQLSGPGLGGFLIHAVGAGRTLVIEASAFVAATLLVLAVRSSFDHTTDQAPSAALDAVREGVAVIFRDPLIRVLTMTAIAANIVLAGTITLIVPLLRTTVGLSAAEVGWVLAAGAAMGLVAVPTIGPLERRLGGARIVALGTGAQAVLVVLVSLCTGLVTAVPAYAALSLVQWAVMAAFIGERQRRAPEHLQARVGISGRMIAVGALTAGSALASGLSGLMALRELYLAMALAGLVVAAGSAPVILRAARRPVPATIR